MRFGGDLVASIDIEINIKKHACSTCPYTTEKKFNLKRHFERQHLPKITGTRAERNSDECKKSQESCQNENFESNLIRNLSNSSKVKRSDEENVKTFSQIKNIGGVNINDTVRSTDKNYECDTNELVSNEDNENHPSKRFRSSCTECSYSSDRQRNVKRHMINAHPENPIFCHYCKTKFKSEHYQ